jgi:hypothetical protein
MSRGLALFVRRDGLGYAYALVRLSTAREEFAASKAPGPSDRYPGEMTAMEWELEAFHNLPWTFRGTVRDAIELVRAAPAKCTRGEARRPLRSSYIFPGKPTAENPLRFLHCSPCRTVMDLGACRAYQVRQMCVLMPYIPAHAWCVQ